MGKFFNVDFNPDIVDGDISEANGTDIAGGDILFDWQAIDIPKGGSLLKSITAYANAEDGAAGSGSLVDMELVFARSVNGVAPPTMGATNAVQTGCGELRHHWVGGIRLESTTIVATLSKLTFGVGYTATAATIGNAGTGGVGLPIVMDLEPDSGTNVGYDKLYVAAFQVTARNWGTGVLADGAVDASSALSTTITVKTVDATKLFSPGDQVYVFDLDTPIPGTLTAVTATTLTFSTANTTVDIADGDELINANPIRFKFGFEK